jgi:prepilin-type N-terminal cleavage/methylation domain-containing protein
MDCGDIGTARRRRGTTLHTRLATRFGKLGDEGGFTLIELLTSMTILLVVLGGVLTSLVSASTAQADLQTRFETQETARLALSTFQRDVRCATAISPATSATTSVTLTQAAGCSSTTGSVTWCTMASGGAFDVWRVPGTACNTVAAGARRWADDVTTAAIFTPDATTHAGAPVSPSVKLSLAVGTGSSKYQLTTSVFSRRAVRQ